MHLSASCFFIYIVNKLLKEVIKPKTSRIKSQNLCVSYIPTLFARMASTHNELFKGFIHIKVK
jgi:hypothetical protein